MYPANRRKHFLSLKLNIPTQLRLADATSTPLPEVLEKCTANPNCDLVQTAMKFFLSQRGQVPIPYEKIPTKATEDFRLRKQMKWQLENGNDNMLNGRQVSQVHNFVMNGNVPGPGGRVSVNSNFSDGEDSEITLKEKLKLMKIKRKKLHDERKQEIKLNKVARKEDRILDAWQATFQSVSSLLTHQSNSSTSGKNSVAVLLMFGASIYNPKEVIIFEIMNDVHSSNLTSDDVIKATRSFYKSLIMSDAYTEFTEKRLRSTYSHVCLLTDNPLSTDIIGIQGLVRLENINWLNSLSCTTITDNQGEIPSRRHVLHIKLDSQCSAFHSIFKLNMNDTCFYKLPLRFKGISNL